MATRFRIEQSPDGIVTSHAGMALIGLFVNRYTDLKKDLRDFLPHNRGISHDDIAKTYIGLVCQGKNDFEAVNGVQGDTFFQRSLGIKQMPSEATLRQRFDEYASDFVTCFDRAGIQLLSRAKVPISTLSTGHVALDIDGSVFDNSGTKKEGVERTYKGIDGYGAMMAYLGEEGWCIGAELKPGSWHGQFEFDHFLERVLPRARQLTNKPLLVRLDGGHDAKANRTSFEEAGVDYIIRWNPRQKGAGDVHAYIAKMPSGELVWAQNVYSGRKWATDSGPKWAIDSD